MLGAIMTQRIVFAAEHLQFLFAALHQQGYQTVGSTIRDGAAVQDKVFMAGAHVDPNL